MLPLLIIIVMTINLPATAFKINSQGTTDIMICVYSFGVVTSKVYTEQIARLEIKCTYILFAVGIVCL